MRDSEGRAEKKTVLMVASHAHLSPSAAEDEFEALYRSRLKPFIAALHRYPKIPAAIHYSGPLLVRLEQKKPELFVLIKELAARKQLELLGGGFYEPAMPLLPLADKIGQIEMLTTYIRQNFGRKPQGCYLACSFWEPSLVGVLSACGMDYTFLSEEQFAAASKLLGGGNGEGDSGGTGFLSGPVSTEDQGKLLVVFPAASSLAVMGSRGAPAVLRELPEERRAGPFLVFPEFSAGGEEPFFAGLAAAPGELDLSTPGRVYRQAGMLPRGYFPPSGALRPQSRAFLVRSPEANDFYAKLYFVHNLINQLRGDKSRKRAAREELWKAQGAEALCLLGGRDLTVPAVREHAARAVLAAEQIVREKDFKPSLLAFDFNLDRGAEYLFQDKNVNCYVQSRGGAVFEFDYLPRGWNYLNTFSGSSRRRCAFEDMLLPGDFTFGGGSGSPPPPGSRLCGGELYTASSSDRAKLRAVFVLPPRKGIPFGSMEIQKTYRLEKNLLSLSYVLRNRGEEKTVLCFVPRFDLSLAGERLLFRKSQGEEESGEQRGFIRRVLAVEEENSKTGPFLSVGFQSPCDLAYYPVEAAGFRQSLCFLPVFQLFLNPGDEWENRITVTVSAKSRAVK
ncbi:MAG: alpha-amylase [Treponema sp.]|jgi:hypothetical protein|nr:alpha-amylase [Treponema sp.]